MNKTKCCINRTLDKVINSHNAALWEIFVDLANINGTPVYSEYKKIGYNEIVFRQV